MFEHLSVELLPERKALGGGWWNGFGDIDQNIDLDQDVDVDVDNSSCYGDVDVTAFNNASIDQNAR
ncbi:hypothetical protein SAMN02982929_02030 [Saccharopolyspora kobensis]|uniref:Uncharacterized protein n=1 Tax=Saccharopolyspora kobensis TaxID=146035 RepID=A0A1H5ZWT0_9PSEU|nr:hypothetical protein [Saccharopolyspora kobensis]SEG40651.1 hypothetical protein SAMN02982929_02030 [Saccharopolyspora kobensis]SFE15422.1 hypothetical protein SAMN05216506_10991 [Saccharopolyspora kobensis]